MDNSEQRVAVVTGASKGIGAGVARQLARAGYDVYVTYRSDAAGADRVAREVRASGPEAFVTPLEVTDPSSVADLFAQVESSHHRLDLLVNNAVLELSKPILEQSLEDWRTVLSVKLDGAFLCTKAAIPLFEKSACAAMVAISSFEGEQPNPAHPAYGVATAGINAFVKAMALYLPQFGARCNAVCPGAVRTPLWEGEGYDDDRLWEEMATANPVGRNATPDDIGRAVVTFATDQSRMLNGNFLYVNGGNHLREP